MEKTLSEGKVQAGDLPALGGVVALESPAMVEVEVEMEMEEDDRRLRGVQEYDGEMVGGD